jgi:hypothetical protein
MSAWHRAHPELAGSAEDPWSAVESYRRLAPMSEMERDLLRDERAAVEDDERRARVEERESDDAPFCPHCYATFPGDDYCWSCGEAV